MKHANYPSGWLSIKISCNLMNLQYPLMLLVLGSRSKATGTENDARKKLTKKGQVPHLGPYMGTQSHITSGAKSDTSVGVPSKQTIGKNQVILSM